MSDVPLTNQNLQYVHPLIQNLLPQEQWSHLPVAGRLKHFQKSWEQLTSDPQVSEIIEVYQIPFSSEPKQMKPLNPVHLSETENSLLENQSHAKKRCHSDDEGLSKSVFKPIIFFDREKRLGLKTNQNIPYVQFKMEGLSLLQELLQKAGFLCNLDLKDSYFSVALQETSQKYVRFPWRGNPYEFLCLCIGLRPAPRIFTKPMKIPIALMRRLKVRLITYLNDILVVGSSLDEMMISKDHIEFYITESGVRNKLTKIRCESFPSNSVPAGRNGPLSMIVSPFLQKKGQITLQCQDVLHQSDLILRQMTQLIGRLS